MALLIATGVEFSEIKNSLDKLEDKAIRHKQFSNEDKKCMRIKKLIQVNYILKKI